MDGKRFVTARGWVDLSDMIRLYEKQGYAVNEQLIGQYLQDKQIAKGFAVYYDLFRKYRSDYQVDAILAGKATPAIGQRAEQAKFDERLSLLSLLLDAAGNDLRAVCEAEDMMRLLMNDLRPMRAKFAGEDAEAAAGLLTDRSEASPSFVA